MKKVFQIAIDGPEAAGKGTVSTKLAEKLGFLYVDTGATYRIATLLAIRNGMDLERIKEQDQSVVSELAQLVKESKIELSKPQGSEKDGRLVTAKVDGEDVSWEIRKGKVSGNVAYVARLAGVREVLVGKQQEIAGESSVVMEGRDITYRVLPDAALKIFLDASLEERVRRRCGQLAEKGEKVDSEEVRKRMVGRDEIDKSRSVDPLKIVSGVWHLDTSDMSIDEVVEKIVGRVEELRE